MGGNSGAGAQGQGQAGDQQLIQEAMAAWQFAFPLMQQLAPELLSTVQGNFTPLTEAARAPVIGQTQQDIRTLQNQAGGTANPNALYQDMAMSGQQAAGIAGDNMLSSALSGLTNLIQGSMAFSGQGLGTGAGQLNQLGEYQQSQYDQEQQNFWSGLLGGLGGFAGQAGGAGGLFGSHAAAPPAVPGNVNMSGVMMPPAASVPLPTTMPANAAYNASGVPTAQTQSGSSVPASGNSAASNMYPGGDYYGALNYPYNPGP